MLGASVQGGQRIYGWRGSKARLPRNQRPWGPLGPGTGAKRQSRGPGARPTAGVLYCPAGRTLSSVSWGSRPAVRLGLGLGLDLASGLG